MATLQDNPDPRHPDWEYPTEYQKKISVDDQKSIEQSLEGRVDNGKPNRDQGITCFEVQSRHLFWTCAGTSGARFKLTISALYGCYRSTVESDGGVG